MTQPPLKAPPTQDERAPEHLSARLRAHARIGALGTWFVASGLFFLFTPSKLPSLLVAICGLGFAWSMLRIARAVDQRADAPARGDIPPPLATPRIVARLFGSIGAHLITLALVLAGTAGPLALLLVLAELWDSHDPVTLSVTLIGGAAVIMLLLHALARRAALWGTQQAMLAAQDRATIQRMATARKQQGGALSLDESGGATGGLTEAAHNTDETHDEAVVLDLDTTAKPEARHKTHARSVEHQHDA